ncbi:MAG: hypothetical protein JWN71_2743 [Xanthobacteraceae bacterium]|jgi:hypothetical protein|nr:hypothetical protein [Xanthobacteraceae bacterium]
MGAFHDAVRSGAFLTVDRMRLVALAVLIASGVGLAYLLITSTGLNDALGRPLGTDFSNVYAAGTYVLEGRPAAPFDIMAQQVRERAIFGPDTQLYGWHYPPFFLFPAAALALLPYLAALAVWQGVTLALYLTAILAILRPALSATLPGKRPDGLVVLAALAYPAVFVNLGHGHNGFLTAALIGFALVQLDRRPVLAGILFGLLAYKPQFGVMIPLVLLATGRWRTFIAAAATVAALALAATLAFGWEVWPAFLEGTRFTRDVILEQGSTGWHKIQSLFAIVRMWGGGIALAYAAQAILGLGLAVALVWLWRRPTSSALKAAALCLAAILATPYSLDYDMMVLAPAIAFFVADGLQRGFLSYEKTALAVLWLTPLIARSVAEATLIPLGVPAMLLVFGLILRRAATEPSHGQGGFLPVAP